MCGEYNHHHEHIHVGQMGQMTIAAYTSVWSWAAENNLGETRLLQMFGGRHNHVLLHGEHHSPLHYQLQAQCILDTLCSGRLTI